MVLMGVSISSPLNRFRALTQAAWPKDHSFAICKRLPCAAGEVAGAAPPGWLVATPCW
jgi:hypothetical protein